MARGVFPSQKRIRPSKSRPWRHKTEPACHSSKTAGRKANTDVFFLACLVFCLHDTHSRRCELRQVLKPAVGFVEVYSYAVSRLCIP